MTPNNISGNKEHRFNRNKCKLIKRHNENLINSHIKNDILTSTTPNIEKENKVRRLSLYKNNNLNKYALTPICALGKTSDMIKNN